MVKEEDHYTHLYTCTICGHKYQSNAKFPLTDEEEFKLADVLEKKLKEEKQEE